MWSGGQPWRLSPEPRVAIGTANGAPAYRLFRVYGAARLQDGRIVVVNGGTNELRFYDPAGQFLFATGREGEGPGEFRSLQTVWQLASDSLLAYDFLVQRLSVLSLDGAYARSFRVESPAGRQLLVRGLFRDGSLLVAGTSRVVAAGTSSGMVRASAPYFRYSRDGVLVDTLGRFPSGESYRLVLRKDDYRLTSPPFARNPRTTVAGDHFAFGASDEWEIGLYSAAGSLQRLIRLERGNRAVTSEDKARFRDERLEWAMEGGPESVMVAKRMLAAVPFPETMPAYGALELDAEGNLWVAHYTARWEEQAAWTTSCFATRSES